MQLGCRGPCRRRGLNAWSTRSAARDLAVTGAEVAFCDGYPLDKQEQAALAILEQAEGLCGEVAARARARSAPARPGRGFYQGNRIIRGPGRGASGSRLRFTNPADRF